MALIQNFIKVRSAVGVLLVLLVFFAHTSIAIAAFNPQINYQGKIRDSAGALVADGDYNIRFNLYTVSTGGSSIWAESHDGANVVTVSKGLFSLMLGSVSSIAAVDFDQTLYLGVEIGGTGAASWDGEMTPRKVFGAVPAAFNATNATNLNGQADSYYLARANHTGTLDVASGGTGAITAAAARTNLALVIGTDVQAFDADLTDLADGTLSASAIEDKFLRNDGNDTTTGVITSAGLIANGALTVTGTVDVQGDLADSLGDFTIADNTTITGTLLNSGLATFSSGININTETFTDLTGSALSNLAGVLTVDATTAGTTAVTSSNSGLEVNADGLSLLRGCADGETLAWNSSTSVWECSTDRATYHIIKTVDYTNNTTTLSDVPDMSFPIGASEDWYFEMNLVVNGDADNDSRASVTCPTGATASWAAESVETAASRANQDCGTTTGNVALTNADDTYTVQGLVQNSTTAGTVQLQLRENSVTDTGNLLTVYANSVLQAWKLSGADYAEIYYSHSDTIARGNLISIDPSTPSGVLLATRETQQSMIGVVSTDPGHVIGEVGTVEGATPVPVALSGRIPVLVNNQNGAIVPGDKITISDTAGVGMKAVNAGYVIGTAITNLQAGESTGTILVFVTNQWFPGATVAVDSAAVGVVLSEAQESIDTSMLAAILTASTEDLLSTTWLGESLQELTQFVSDLAAQSAMYFTKVDILEGQNTVLLKENVLLKERLLIIETKLEIDGEEVQISNSTNDDSVMITDQEVAPLSAATSSGTIPTTTSTTTDETEDSSNTSEQATTTEEEKISNSSNDDSATTTEEVENSSNTSEQATTTESTEEIVEETTEEVVTESETVVEEVAEEATEEVIEEAVIEEPEPVVEETVVEEVAADKVVETTGEEQVSPSE